jgi:hypothetical protein
MREYPLHARASAQQGFPGGRAQGSFGQSGTSVRNVCCCARGEPGGYPNYNVHLCLPSKVRDDELVELTAFEQLCEAKFTKTGIVGDCSELLYVGTLCERSDEGF